MMRGAVFPRQMRIFARVGGLALLLQLWLEIIVFWSITDG
jgi:hypothetical protein